MRAQEEEHPIGEVMFRSLNALLKAYFDITDTLSKVSSKQSTSFLHLASINLQIWQDERIHSEWFVLKLEMTESSAYSLNAGHLHQELIS